MEYINTPENNFRGVWSSKKQRTGIPIWSSLCFYTPVIFAQVFDLLANDGRNGDMELLSKSAIEKLSTPVVIGSDTILLDESIYSMGMKLYRRFEGTSKVSC